MAKSFIEIIYIDNEDQARQTNLRLQLETDAATWKQFRAYRPYEVGIKSARFLLDYHNARGDLRSTIPIDATGFKAITGQHPKTDDAYCQIDTEFWAEVSKPRDPAPVHEG